MNPNDTYEDEDNYIVTGCDPEEYDDEYDGQPDEAQEWYDYDPDC
jgi:hypothetical protein